MNWLLLGAVTWKPSRASLSVHQRQHDRPGVGAGGELGSAKPSCRPVIQQIQISSSNRDSAAGAVAAGGEMLIAIPVHTQYRLHVRTLSLSTGRDSERREDYCNLTGWEASPSVRIIGVELVVLPIAKIHRCATAAAKHMRQEVLPVRFGRQTPKMNNIPPALDDPATYSTDANAAPRMSPPPSTSTPRPCPRCSSRALRRPAQAGDLVRS